MYSFYVHFEVGTPAYTDEYLFAVRTFSHIFWKKYYSAINFNGDKDMQLAEYKLDEFESSYSPIFLGMLGDRVYFTSSKQLFQWKFYIVVAVTQVE